MSAPSVPIAIIGMSCRFAGGATDPEKLWQLCAEGKTGWSEVPEDRYRIDGHYHPRPDNLNTTNVKGACFLDEDVGNFDATFFNLPAETAAVSSGFLQTYASQLTRNSVWIRNSDSCSKVPTKLLRTQDLP